MLVLSHVIFNVKSHKLYEIVSNDGAYKDLDFDNSPHPTLKNTTIEQKHHMPSQAAGNKGINGGALTMETNDHKQTASFDNIAGSKNYRDKQKDLIENGKFQEAFQMDIDDIKRKFENKYDDGINQLAQRYRKQGKIKQENICL